MRRALALLGAMALATQLSACQGYLFRQSDRLTITSPANHATVHEPLTITWQAHEFSAPQDGRFAVFVDRDPMSPGDNLSTFARTDRDGIYVLDTTSLHIDVLSPLSGVDPAEQNHHDVTVVLLDTQGNRMGEYAGFAEFNVEQST